VKGRQYLKIVAEHFESVARGPLNSLPTYHSKKLEGGGPLLKEAAPLLQVKELWLG
jgi:hypothetical protein